MSDYKRIVVKVGTSTLTHPSGKLNLLRIERLAMVLSDLANQGRDIVLVTSGAIGVGMGKLGFEERPTDIALKQALAAVGQGMLMQIYEKMFSEFGRVVAQILITKEDIFFEDRNKNAMNTFNELLRHGIIPIVNENDTIATDEIKIGDNDVLSAYVAKLLNADLLIILSDIDGLYDKDPIFKDAKLISRVTNIDEKVKGISKGSNTNLGTGGMRTKINAAQITMESGIAMVIANGNRPDNIYDILEGKDIGTLFKPE
ncbi:glutamate 5-kinase [Oxobacter pfennigii]|uniref:Glutamate 5-kinase n=1 Tax=Oxobacter pfennigii TaxID=36849 RepID=A0A0P8YAB4_9CLOT|nr:glutamate 5-kinase [Oxobacter pfennigii]KPU43883.1 glutamate 5-kinase [Oxobacter pfennigii]